MKSLFLLALLILFSNIFAKPNDKALATAQLLRSYYVKIINYARQEYSIGFKISNMQALRHNIELEQEAKTFLTCDDIKHGSNLYRAWALSTIFNSTYLTDPDARWIKNNAEALKTKSTFIRDSEFLHPLQSEMACVDLISECPLSDGPLAGYVCLFGPKTTEPLSEWKYRKPMSDCPKRKTGSGLCDPFGKQ